MNYAKYYNYAITVLNKTIFITLNITNEISITS